MNSAQLQINCKNAVVEVAHREREEANADGEHDDQVDSTSQFLDWSKRRPTGWGIFEYYRQLAENQRQPSNQPIVKLKAPPGISHVIAITGRVLSVQPDRTIEVTEEEVKPLRAAGFADGI